MIVQSYLKNNFELIHIHLILLLIDQRVAYSTFDEHCYLSSKVCNDSNIIFETEVISSFEIHGPIVILNPDS